MSEAGFRDALAVLYERFAAPAPQRIEGCPCCVDRKTRDVLHGKPLHEITPEELGAYAASVLLTVGSVDDFRYFLPRMLELSATDLGWYPTPEIAIGKLRLAGWAGWSAIDQKAVLDVLRAWWLWRLDEADQTHGPYDSITWELESILCGMARAGLDLDPFLYDLRSRPRVVADLAARCLWQPWENASLLPKGAFWGDCPQAGRLFADFLRQAPRNAEK